jgi:hypothetical protein
MPLPSLAWRAVRLIPADPLWRKLIALRLADSMGRGIIYSGSIVYFTLHVGLSAREVALGLSSSALAALTSVVVIGVIADRTGKRRLLTLLFAAMAVGFGLYSLVHNAAEFFPLIIALAFVEAGTEPTEDALMVTIVPADQLVGLKAMMRTVFNVGFSLGIGVSAVAATSQHLLIVIPLGAATVMTGTAILATRLPAGSPIPNTHRIRQFSAVRDLTYLKVIGFSAILALHASIVVAVLPLWALHRTSVPHFAVPALLIFNTAFVILFQVRASKGIDDVRSAGHIARRSGYWLAAGCAVASVTALRAVGDSGLVATGILIAAILCFSVAEIMQSASGWALAFGLAPPHAQGEYLGAFQLHVISQAVVGPAVLSGVVIAYGFWGWTGIAVLVLIASALIAPAALRAEAVMKARQVAAPEAASQARP